MKGTSNRGFASMDAQRQREIARKGGQAAHQKGTAHEFTSDEARQAGRKGGERVSANRQHMAEIGRRGGQKSSGRRREQGQAQSRRAASPPPREQSTPHPETSVSSAGEVGHMPQPSPPQHHAPPPA